MRAYEASASTARGRKRGTEAEVPMARRPAPRTPEQLAEHDFLSLPPSPGRGYCSHLGCWLSSERVSS